MKLTENPRRPGRVLPMRVDEPCTGVTARFCPRHGTCTCPGTDVGYPARPGPMDSPRCPLHAPDSVHAEPPPIGLVLRGPVDVDAPAVA